MITTTNRYSITIGLVAAAMFPLAAQAQVLGGTAAKVPSYQARGATQVPALGPLAPSLQGKPVVVRIHANWCSACKATQSTIDRLRQAYAGQINFIQFDVTNAKAAAASQAHATALGLEAFYAATRTATSTVAVIDPKDGKIYATFYNDGAIGDYRSAIDAALKADKSST